MTHEPFAVESRVRGPLSFRPSTRFLPSMRGELVDLDQEALAFSHTPLRSAVVRAIDGTKYRFACATSAQQHDLASELVMRRYAWRGYDAEGALGGNLQAGEVTFVAHCGARVDGTLTVRIDGQTELLAEQLYPQEIERLRRRGARLCEFGRLAFDEGVNTLEILGPLFHLGLAYARGPHACTDMVIEVNPRHVGFYQRVFGFEVLGEERTCDRVSAPAVLLRLPLGEAAFHAEVQGGERAGRRSIYPYCLGEAEISEFRRELARLQSRVARDNLANAGARC
jgi:N-acyl amino acid synthase FeeM